MARKVTFADMIVEETSKEAVEVPAEDLSERKERLLKMVERTLAEDGKQGAMKAIVFGKAGEFETFLGEISAFYDELPDELKPNRIYITNSDDCDFHILALAKRVTPKYTALLEDDMNRGQGHVMRIILNKEYIPMKLKKFFEALGFVNMNTKLTQAMIHNMDERCGIDVYQITLPEFQEKFGSRKDWFRFGDAYAVYDEGKLFLTHKLWKKAVSLKLPEDGSKPWRYRYFKNESGLRVEAYFRVNLYGALWFTPAQ